MSAKASNLPFTIDEHGQAILTTVPITLAYFEGHLYYLTACCGASVKGSIADGSPSIVCRNCYRGVDDVFADSWQIDDEAGWARYHCLVRADCIADVQARQHVARVRRAAEHAAAEHAAGHGRGPARQDPPAPVLTDTAKSLLADWFPLRDRLDDLRTKELLSTGERAEIEEKLRELVDIADELVAHFVPDVHARFAITGDILP
ncbi:MULTISPECIES: hypothetical protein [Mycolicibacterium]|uniref:hypothetical protein n=1 Tax=Mycolicibacterium TaxID=1866885 RepID=UPI000698F7B8|nr:MULTISPECIES: hypothetical protein [Mycolicibacterium]MCT7373241.1 hypothetical protein [Mycolicibacterium llatzerense]WGI35877.1 hypothetical protein QDT91_27690 [Mycolicibacterium aubagnense]